MSNPSLCIPSVFLNITKEQIYQNLKHLGEIDRIDFGQKNATGGKLVFIYFIAWYREEHAIKIRELVLSGGEFNIQYCPQYFWKISEKRRNVPREDRREVRIDDRRGVS